MTSWGADSRARRIAADPNRLSIKQGRPKVCHCEEAGGRRGNLAETSWTTGRPRRIRSLVREIATAPSGPRNDKSGDWCGRRCYHITCWSARRSGNAATDAIGFYHFNDSYSKFEVPFRDCTPRALPRASRSGRHGRRAPLQWQIREQLP